MVPRAPAPDRLTGVTRPGLATDRTAPARSHPPGIRAKAAPLRDRIPTLVPAALVLLAVIVTAEMWSVASAAETAVRESSRHDRAVKLAPGSGIAVPPPARARPSEEGFRGVLGWHDGSAESAYAWQNDGVMPPMAGAFAARVPVLGRLTAVVLHLTQSGQQAGQTMDVLVWADQAGEPGPLLGVVPGVDPGPVGLWPNVTVHEVPFELDLPSEPDAHFWIGYWGAWPGQLPGWYVAADLNGLGEPTRTFVAPGMPWPQGWQDVSLVFGVTASLGLQARQDQIVATAPAGRILGGGGNGAPLVLTGSWDFDLLSPAQRQEPVSCENTMQRPFGELITLHGWQPAPESTVPPRIEELGDWIDPELYPGAQLSHDVGGGVIACYEPNLGGFLPGQVSIMQSMPIDVSPSGLGADLSALRLRVNSNPDGAQQGLVLRVGTRSVALDGRIALSCVEIPIGVPRGLPEGPGEVRAPVLVHDAAETARAEVGVENEDVEQPKESKGPAIDEVEVETKAPAGTSTWKYVPDISQGGAAICQGTAFANCLSYWAQNGYPELTPAGTTQEEKNKALQDSLKKYCHDQDLGDGGVTKYMRGRGVMKPQPQRDGRQPLEHVRRAGAKATWDFLTEQFEQCHDVLLRLQWYNEDGELVDADAAHYVTVAGIETRADGSRVIHVANPWGESHHAPGADSRDTAYDKLEVTVGPDGRIRVDHDSLEDNAAGIDEDETEYLCVTDINVIRPAARSMPRMLVSRTPDGAVGNQPAPAPDDRSSTPGEGARASSAYAYSILNEDTTPLFFFSLQIDVPVSNVTAPSGWTWQPLPVPYPDAGGCGAYVGGPGILWSTETDAVPPGGELSGFGFEADDAYPEDEYGLIWYTQTEGLEGEFGPVAGPVPAEVSGLPEPQTPDRALFHLTSVPNPSGGDVAIRFMLAESRWTKVSIYDPQGRLLKVLSHGLARAGENEVLWDRRDQGGRLVPAGVYYYRLEAGEIDRVGRMVLVHQVLSAMPSRLPRTGGRSGWRSRCPGAPVLRCRGASVAPIPEPGSSRGRL